VYITLQIAKPFNTSGFTIMLLINGTTPYYVLGSAMNSNFQLPVKAGDTLQLEIIGVPLAGLTEISISNSSMVVFNPEIVV
jgi:hypothetical protein